MKRCTRCKAELPEWRALRYCAPCAAAMARERRARDPEKVREADRRRYLKRSAEQRERARRRTREAYQRERLERASGRICEECGGPIPIETILTKKTCSDVCQRARQNARVRGYYYRKGGGARGTEESSRNLSEAAKRQWANGRTCKPRECRCCGREFTPASPPHRYCSDECKRYAVRGRLYGLTAAAMKEVFESHDFRCALCGEVRRGWATSKSRKDGLIVDHCHTTGRVRGILCGDCNTALGRFGDDPARLRAAAEYLER